MSGGSDVRRPKSDVRAIVLLMVVALATSLPFVRRAYFVDDYYFVTMAKGILQSPWRPYDFKSDDAGIGNVGWERGHAPRMVNPPLFHYYLAGVIKMFGDQPWVLRTSTLPFSLIALVAMYFLGKRFVPDPLFPALLMAVTPAYLLTSYSLLIDSALIAFLLISLWLFIVSHEKRSLMLNLLSGVLMGLTMLVKYFGILIIPLALAWTLIDPDRRRWKEGYFAFRSFLVIQILWGFWNVLTYGQMHFIAALPRGMGTPSLMAWAQKALVMGSFMGGGTLFVLAAPFLLWRLSTPWRYGMVGMMAGLLALFLSRAGGFGWNQALLLSLFIFGAFTFLIVMGRLLDLHDKNQLFLLIWVLGGILELVIVMPWTAGRYFLCVLPALCWVFWLLTEKLEWRRLFQGTLAVTVVGALLIAHGDYVQANTIVELANNLRERQSEFQQFAPKPAHHWYYLADTFDGSQPYLLPLGWENVLPYQKFKPGDLFLRARYRKSSWWNVEREMKRFRPMAHLDVRSWNPIRVMDVPASAGFYASVWGALPWALTNHPLERFELYQAIAE